MSNSKIIVVDDEILNLSIVKVLLQREDLDVSTATSGEECLELMSNKQFDVAVLDIMMPEINGFDLCKKIKELNPYVIVIFLTANIDDESIEKAFNSGGFDYIEKPLRKVELIARIHNAIRVRKAEKRLHDALKELESKNKVLEMRATIDGLTELVNHVHIKKLLDLRFEEAKRYSHPLSVLMLDLDNFKTVNDSYGHLEGDNALKIIAKRLKNSIRKIDICGRYGGEEFLIILPNTELKYAVIVAENLREVIESTKFSGHEICLTVSIGVASINDEMQTTNQLIRKADVLLYKAKNKGRNRIEY
ncbi:MAG: diguanylate cyclase [bacterium]|nr:diguanylate cyclase [bacterium]